VAGVFASSVGEIDMMYWGWNGGPGGWVGAVIAGLIWLLIIGVFVFVIVRLVSGPRRSDGYWTQQARPDDPEEILRARFARGEIPPDEFEQRLEVLRRTRPAGPPTR
jgi:putative membrane protein